MFETRKIKLWLLSLFVIFMIYQLYSRITQTPKIMIDAGSGVVDSSNNNVGDNVGIIGDVGIGKVYKARYVHLNEKKEMDREFGFEKLLHESGDYWDIEKPFMKMFRPDLVCSITSDRGNVQIEMAAGKPSPKDATLSGNVVIHIQPKNGSMKESFVYLDDVVFISERSQFSTDGPVKFVSEDAQMLGRGLELIYNDQLGRLEYFRIKDLYSLKLRYPAKEKKTPSLFASSEKAVETVGTPSVSDAVVDAESVVEAKPVGGDGGNVVEEEKQAEAAGNRYVCLLNRNVVIDAPEGLIFADQVYINNILLDRGSGRDEDESPKVEVAGTDKTATGGIGKVANTNDLAAATDASSQTASKAVVETESGFVEILINCDDGITVFPVGSSRKVEIAAAEPNSRDDIQVGEGQKPVFVATRIDYDAEGGGTIAKGASELTFYIKDIIAGQNEPQIVPVKVTSEERVRFLPASNQIIFEGDCLSKMVRSENAVRRQYSLSAPRLVVDLADGDGDREEDDSAYKNMKSLTADGGTVRLSMLKKTTADELLGGVELKCSDFNYDTVEQRFVAKGPGLIKIDNSRIDESEEKAAKFSLQKRCIAVVQNFDVLEYSLGKNQITVDAEDRRILIDYFPIGQGKDDEQISITAGHIEAFLAEGLDGRNELSLLNASGGISYVEEGGQKKWGGAKAVEFHGSRMTYDAEKEMVKARGSDFWPCTLNGVMVDAIEYNLKSGKASKVKIVGPGVLQ